LSIQKSDHRVEACHPPPPPHAPPYLWLCIWNTVVTKIITETNEPRGRWPNNVLGHVHASFGRPAADTMLDRICFSLSLSRTRVVQIACTYTAARLHSLSLTLPDPRRAPVFGRLELCTRVRTETTSGPADSLAIQLCTRVFIYTCATVNRRR